MYCIEGEITTRTNPETLIGEFGAFHTDVIYDHARTNRTFSSTGSRDFVEESIERWVEEEAVSPGVTIELIDDVPTAEKYISKEEHKTGLERKEEPDVFEVVTARIPEGRELLLAKLALWREVRSPFSRVYNSAEGTLLALFNFDTERGWYEPHARVEGERKLTGLVTPRRHNVTVVDHIEARDSEPGSPYPKITVIDATETHKGDFGRFLNITKAVGNPARS